MNRVFIIVCNKFVVSNISRKVNSDTFRMNDNHLILLNEDNKEGHWTTELLEKISREVRTFLSSKDTISSNDTIIRVACHLKEVSRPPYQERFPKKEKQLKECLQLPNLNNIQIWGFRHETGSNIYRTLVAFDQPQAYESFNFNALFGSFKDRELEQELKKDFLLLFLPLDIDMQALEGMEKNKRTGYLEEMRKGKIGSYTNLLSSMAEIFKNNHEVKLSETFFSISGLNKSFKSDKTSNIYRFLECLDDNNKNTDVLLSYFTNSWSDEQNIRSFHDWYSELAICFRGGSIF